MSAVMPPPLQPWYEFGDFRLIPDERLLLRVDSVIHLSPKVFDTLVALVQNSGRLLLKRELLSLIWPGTVVEENNLTQAVCAIRKALAGAEPGCEYIETIPKQGYRFVASVTRGNGQRVQSVSGGLAAERAPEPGAGSGRLRWAAAGTLTLAVALSALAAVGLGNGWWRAASRRAPHAAAVDRSGTESMPAYRSYLDGLSALNQRTDPSLRAAIYYFERAIELDSTYASAYAALADCYVLLGLYNASSDEVRAKASAAATKAAQLDSASPEAHTALAAVHAYYEWDWPGASGAFEHALQLNPAYAMAHHWYAVAYWVPMRRYAQALAHVEHARRLDPRSLIIQTDVGWVYYMMRRYDHAIAEYDSVIRRDPTFVPAHYFLSLAYERKGLYQRALAERTQASALNAGGTTHFSMARIRDLASYRSALRSLTGPDSALGPPQAGLYSGAIRYMQLGEHQRAVVRLQLAYRHRDPALIYVVADPMFDDVRSDPRLEDLARRMGLPR